MLYLKKKLNLQDPRERSSIKGFTLVEICICLIFTGFLLGGMVFLYGNLVDFTKNSKIIVEGIEYPKAHTMEAKIDAFQFHNQLVKIKQKSHGVFCFGGCDRVGQWDTPPLQVSLDFVNINWPKVTTTRALYNKVNPLSESAFTKQDWTLVLLLKENEDVIYVQSRLKKYFLEKQLYHLYSIIMTSVKGDIKLADYHYAIAASEDFYEKEQPITRYFQGEGIVRERCCRVIFPDPCLCSDFNETLKEISRYVYIFDTW